MPQSLPDEADVVVVGAGNAAMCSAISAAEAGASVIVLEKAPKAERGGNGVFTGGFLRFSFDGFDDLQQIVQMNPDEVATSEVGCYSTEDFYLDVAEVTDYRADSDLVELLVNESHPTVSWLRSIGVPFLPSFGLHPRDAEGTAHFLGRAPAAEVSGGGAGLIDALYRRAEGLGIPVLYEARAAALETEDGRITGVRVRQGHAEGRISTRSVVLASGGYEANSRMRATYLGPDWDLARVRGSRHNTGDGIAMALAVGAEAFGHWSGCHAAPTDLNSPVVGDRNFTDGFVRRSFHLGIMVNRNGHRFADEGEDHEANTYSTMGRKIIAQPGQIAYQLFDAATVDLLRPEYSMRQATRIVASTLEELAVKLEVEPKELVATVESYNASVSDAVFNPRITDGKSTTGIFPPKSNWAVPLATAPFYAFPVTCGITFTYGGLRVNQRAQVLHEDGQPIDGLFAAGELVGGLFFGNYPTGCGIMAGSVFGRTAGLSASARSRATPV